MCGISDDSESHDMVIKARFATKTIQPNPPLKYTEEREGEYQYDACFYEIDSYINDEEWDELFSQNANHNIKIRLTIHEDQNMDVYIY